MPCHAKYMGVNVRTAKGRTADGLTTAGRPHGRPQINASATSCGQMYKILWYSSFMACKLYSSSNKTNSFRPWARPGNFCHPRWS